MPEQLPLVWPTERPLARRADADSSHAAADRMQRRGRLRRHRELVLAVVRQHPGLTSRELFETDAGQATGLDRHDFGRRLPDLREHGLVACEREPGEPLRWRACDGRPDGDAESPAAEAAAPDGGAASDLRAE